MEWLGVLRALTILSLALLMACAPRGQITLEPSAASVGQVQRIFVGTTRAQMPDGSFGSGRSENLSLARFDISVPPNRGLGEINWPPRHGRRDAQTQFLTVDERVYPAEAGFRADLKRQLDLTGGDAVIFVHGFNNNFAEGLYRLAQLSHDLKLSGTFVQYAWPSAADPLGYEFDRDSAMFARDGLERLIREVERAGAKRILLVAHSMGAELTMETLQQIAIRGGKRTLDHIGGVILISPDIDVDVFRSQAHAIGHLPQPFVIFGSNRDRYLRLSAAVTGTPDRLGSVSDVTSLADLDVTVLDVGNFSAGAGHFVFGDSAALIGLFDSLPEFEAALNAPRGFQNTQDPGPAAPDQKAKRVVLPGPTVECKDTLWRLVPLGC
jgi:esterase/lipase superfamily enzyme